MEEFNTTDYESIEVLDKFSKWIDNFCVENGVIDYKENDQYALTLMNYASLLQKKYDVVHSQHTWCVEALNFLYAKYWDKYDKYLPAEIKKKSIILENSFAQNVEKSRIRLYAAMQILSESARDVRKRVSIFQDLGKHRSFK